MQDITQRIARRILQLKADPGNENLLDRLHDHLEKRRKEFFSAVMDHLPVAPHLQVPLTLDQLPVPAVKDQVTRQTWRNCIANQVFQPLKYFKPATLEELRSILQEAASSGCKAKAIGSGHSFSDVGATTDFLIDTHGLNRVLAVEADLLKDPSASVDLFNTECGIVIRDLNAALDRAGLALANMGGYDAQTIVGAASTSTHGSGLSLGPLSDSIVSLVLAAASGKLYQIEPAEGITDPDRFRDRHPDIELIQDDRWFYSNVVGLGCMGVIYSVTLRVLPKYWLSETRTLSHWDEVKELLSDGAILRENRHCEVLVNPYDVKGRRTCLITKRNFADEPTEPPELRPHRNFFAELTATLPGAAEALVFLFDEVPDFTPRVIDSAMKQLEDSGYVDVSYKVLNLGAANNISAYSSEIGFPMSTYLDAVDRIIEIAGSNRAIGNLYHTAPFSLRFVKASEHYLSMQYGVDTCMIEIPMINGTIGGKEILKKYENAMLEFGGRPHWGQVNYLSGSNDLIRSMYPKYDDWLSVFNELNSGGMFDNTFTDRCGFSGESFAR